MTEHTAILETRQFIEDAHRLRAQTLAKGLRRIFGRRG